MPEHLTYKPIRAPRGHGQVLLEPPRETIGQLLEQNRSDGRNAAYDVQGLSLAQLRSDARRGMLQDARRYTSAYRDVAATAGEDGPVLLAGHQPQLFHPGVWFKNFALSALARRFSGQAVNLLIDNDILRNPSIRVPAGSQAEPQVVTLPFDRVVETIPYEQREIADAELFASFAERVCAASSGVLAQPLIDEYWQLVLEARRRSSNLGRCLAEARHRLEGRWGQNTWEVPLSAVCEAPPFAWFACHLLAQLPRLHEIYNASLREYRRVNHVRSRSHPVPDLERDGDWQEAPFWLWSDAAPARKRAFVQAGRDGLELTDRGTIRVQLPLTGGPRRRQRGGSARRPRPTGDQAPAAGPGDHDVRAAGAERLVSARHRRGQVRPADRSDHRPLLRPAAARVRHAVRDRVAVRGSHARVDASHPGRQSSCCANCGFIRNVI